MRTKGQVIRILSVLVAGLTSILFGLPTTANAAADFTAPGLSSGGHVEMRLDNGETAGWVSIRYLQAHPGAVPGIRVQAVGKSLVQPNDADGCNQNVCIDITGSGLNISRWTSQAFGNVGCSYAVFYYPGGDKTGPNICPPPSSGSGVYYDNNGPTGKFSAGDACNGWWNISGFPCETLSP